MPKRIMLVHAFLPSMPPIVKAFKDGWPEAKVLNLIDEALYADVTPEGLMKSGVSDRVANLLQHCVLGGADGIVFTGSTFGPAVDAARRSISVPVLKADEAMAERAVAMGQHILIVCTAMRAIPIIRGNMEAAAKKAGVQPTIESFCVPGAKEAISAGDDETHERLIAESVERIQQGYDVIVLGQISMVPSRARLASDVAARVLCSPEATVSHMRTLIQS
jgi:Asp/Glu/hydantoin racemase